MNYICTRCNYEGPRKKTIGGSNIVSTLLWVVLPTLYMVWQLRSVGTEIMGDPTTLLQNATNFGIADIAVNAPGPVYSIWRRIKRTYSCPQCTEKVMFPSRSSSILDGINISGKDHVNEMERKLLEMERELQETKKPISATVTVVSQAEFVPKQELVQQKMLDKQTITRNKVDKDEW